MSNTNFAPYGVTLLRVSLGIMLLAHGLMKVLVFTPAGTAQYFESIGFPAVFAYLVIAGEIAGGVALIAGFLTRWAALAAVPILIGATLQHAASGWLFSNTGGGWEFPAFWTVALLAQALLGSGAFALDNIRSRAVQAAAA